MSTYSQPHRYGMLQFEHSDADAVRMTLADVTPGPTRSLAGELLRRGDVARVILPDGRPAIVTSNGGDPVSGSRVVPFGRKLTERERRICRILGSSADAVERARVPFDRCSSCGRATHPDRLREQNLAPVCVDCLERGATTDPDFVEDAGR